MAIPTKTVEIDQTIHKLRFTVYRMKFVMALEGPML